jgi:copper chaperone
MITFYVHDMTCGRCISAITKAVKAIDRDATIEIDLSTHTVTIHPTVVNELALQRAIEDAGYGPVRQVKGADLAATAATAVASKSGGCCCR